MSKGWKSAWLCVALLLASFFASAVEHRRVLLVARVTIENAGATAVAPYFQRITIPVADHPQQRLVDIRHPQGSAQPARKQHKNGIDDYLEYRWELPARATLVREIGFVLDLAPFDEKSVQARAPESPEGSRYLQPSEGIESDAPAIRALAARLAGGKSDPREQAHAAYDHVRRSLKVRRMAQNRGALYALDTGGGDCTEFNSLFVALARAMGIPARTTADFLFDHEPRARFSQPNHHGAEAFLDGRWVPVDANLAVDPSFGYGFGHGGTRKVVLRHEGAWVWGNWAPDEARPTVKARIEWSLRDLAPGER